MTVLPEPHHLYSGFQWQHICTMTRSDDELSHAFLFYVGAKSASVFVSCVTGEQNLFGDLLVLGGATLYGISNVCEEFIINNLSRVEFLGMIGLFGSFFSGIQL